MDKDLIFSANSRLWAKTSKNAETGCWEWTGRTLKGYGVLKIGRTQWYAHRASYRVRVGEIPKGMMICHHCDNPPCINPAHLYAGTALDNARDFKERGVSPKSSRGKYP